MELESSLPHELTNYGHLEDDVRMEALDQDMASAIDVPFGGGSDPDLYFQRFVSVQVTMQVQFRYRNRSVLRTVGGYIDQARELQTSSIKV